MPATSVTVLGGTGFLGQVIVRRLLETGAHVQIAVRHPARSGLDESNDFVRALHADISDEATVAHAMKGADAVINAVGLYVERGAETFDAVHIHGALHVARQAARAGVKRLVHISGIGATPDSPSRYVRSRAQGEQYVQKSFEGTTIVRPSVLFGPGDSFLGSIDAITRMLPVFPLFGSGTTRLQPVHVADVAEAVARILEAPMTFSGVCELGGPRTYTYRELVEMVLDYRGRKRVLLPVPFIAWMAQARLLSVLPSPPLTEDQVILMRQDNAVDESLITLQDLGITPRSIEDSLAACLDSKPVRDGTG